MVGQAAEGWWLPGRELWGMHNEMQLSAAAAKKPL